MGANPKFLKTNALRDMVEALEAVGKCYPAPWRVEATSEGEGDRVDVVDGDGALVVTDWDDPEAALVLAERFNAAHKVARQCLP